MLGLRKWENVPYEAGASYPPQQYHLKYNYTNNHRKSEDRSEDYKKGCSNEKQVEAPQADYSKI